MLNNPGANQVSSFRILEGNWEACTERVTLDHHGFANLDGSELHKNPPDHKTIYGGLSGEPQIKKEKEREIGSIILAQTKSLRFEF